MSVVSLSLVSVADNASSETFLNAIWYFSIRDWSVPDPLAVLSEARTNSDRRFRLASGTDERDGYDPATQAPGMHL